MSRAAARIAELEAAAPVAAQEPGRIINRLVTALHTRSIIAYPGKSHVEIQAEILRIVGPYDFKAAYDEDAPVAAQEGMVSVPTSANQAHGMVNMGLMWLKEHAPERLIAQDAPVAAQEPLIAALQKIDSIAQVLLEGGYGRDGDNRAYREIAGLAQTWLRVKHKTEPRTPPLIDTELWNAVAGVLQPAPGARKP